MNSSELPAKTNSTAPVFLVGCRRSGTTLLSRIIDSHSRIAIYHESALFPIFKQELRWYGDLQQDRNCLALVSDVRRIIGTQVDNPVPGVAEIMQAMHERSLPGVFGALLQLYAVTLGAVRGGDKTPEHHEFLDDLSSAFPDSPILFTMRDPRDTALSICRNFKSSASGAAHSWINAYRSYRRFEDRVNMVRYEDLVSRPAQMVRDITGILGEVFEAEMLEFHKSIPDSFRRPGGEKLTGPIDPGSIGKFKHMLPEDIATIESICREGMETLGYEPVTTRLGPTYQQVKTRSGYGFIRFVWDRLRYYGLNKSRWGRGFVRWNLMFRVRLRYLLRLPGRS